MNVQRGDLVCSGKNRQLSRAIINLYDVYVNNTIPRYCRSSLILICSMILKFVKPSVFVSIGKLLHYENY